VLSSIRAEETPNHEGGVPGCDEGRHPVCWMAALGASGAAAAQLPRRTFGLSLISLVGSGQQVTDSSYTAPVVEPG
jgi:hypothetical protein